MTRADRRRVHGADRHVPHLSIARVEDQRAQLILDVLDRRLGDDELLAIGGDYRFETVKSNDSAPAFFGQETRYGHRVYGAVLINAMR